MGHRALILSEVWEMERRSACSGECISAFGTNEPDFRFGDDSETVDLFPNSRFNTFRHTWPGRTFFLIFSETIA